MATKKRTKTPPSQSPPSLEDEGWVNKRKFRQLLADRSPRDFEKKVKAGLIPPPSYPFGGLAVWPTHVVRDVLRRLVGTTPPPHERAGRPFSKEGADLEG